MYYFDFYAMPTKECRDYEKDYLFSWCAWMNFETEDEARERLYELLEDECSWKIVSLNYVKHTESRNDWVNEKGDKIAQYYDQALIDTEVFTSSLLSAEEKEEMLAELKKQKLDEYIHLLDYTPDEQ